jgi:hypothetical protein
MASRLLKNITTSDLRFNGNKLASQKTIVVTSPLTAEVIKLISSNSLSDVATADPAVNDFPQAFIPVAVNADAANLLAVEESGVDMTVENAGDIVGFFAVKATMFSGAETTFALSAGSVPLELYVLPVTNKIVRQSQYMRSRFSHIDSVNKRYESYAEYIPYKDVVQGYQWQNTSAVQRLDINKGALITALVYGSAVTTILTPQVAPTVTTPAAMTLVANAPFANEPGIVYFDFNWIAEFAAIFPTKEPASIIVTGQPVAGDFKAFVMGNAQPVANMVTLNTVRIVKTIKGNVVAGLRTFLFTINDHLGNETPVILNVTIA